MSVVRWSIYFNDEFYYDLLWFYVDVILSLWVYGKIIFIKDYEFFNNCVLELIILSFFIEFFGFFFVCRYWWM